MSASANAGGRGRRFALVVMILMAMAGVPALIPPKPEHPNRQPAIELVVDLEETLPG